MVSYIGLSTGSVGAIGELKAAADLLARGYEVFRSVSPTTSCDLIIKRNKQFLRIEVRTARRRKNGNIWYPVADKSKSDHVAAVLQDGEVRYFPPLPRPVKKKEDRP